MILKSIQKRPFLFSFKRLFSIPSNHLSDLQKGFHPSHSSNSSLYSTFSNFCNISKNLQQYRISYRIKVLEKRFYSTGDSSSEVGKPQEEGDEAKYVRKQRRRKSEKYGKYDGIALSEEIGTFPEAEGIEHLYNAREVVEQWMGHPTFWGMVSKEALEEKSNEVNDIEPPGEGPILRWETRLILGPGGSAWHPANRKVKVSVYVRELGLTPLARERFVALVGKRYYPNKDEVTIISERFRDREENRKDVLRTLLLLIREAKKADALASGELEPDDLVGDYVSDMVGDYQKERIEEMMKDPAFLQQLADEEKREEEEEEKEREKERMMRALSDGMNEKEGLISGPGSGTGSQNEPVMNLNEAEVGNASESQSQSQDQLMSDHSFNKGEMEGGEDASSVDVKVEDDRITMGDVSLKDTDVAINADVETNADVLVEDGESSSSSMEEGKDQNDDDRKS